MKDHFIFNIKEISEDFILPECGPLWKINIDHKINISPNYYDLSLNNREIILKSLRDWINNELNTVNNIKTI